MIYLDNAATSWPKPEGVYETLGAFLRHAGANPGRAGHRMAVDAAAALAETRLLLARLMNAGAPDRVLFAQSATDALNLAIKGILRPGDRVVTTTMEHNAVTRPLRAMSERGVQVTKVRCPGHGVIEPADVAAAADGARLIIAGHASNVTGAVQPIADLAEIARRAGAWLLVDAAQTFGALPLDVQALGIDLMAFPGHKALLGPPGTGGLYVGPRVDMDDLVPIREGGTGLNSEDDLLPRVWPVRYESGTANTVGVAALGTALRFVADIGVEAICQREQALTERLVSGLVDTPGVRVFRPSRRAHQAAVVSFVIDGWTPADAGAVLDESFDIACRTGLHCAPDACHTIGAFPGGTIRFSPGYFTTDEEIEAALSAVAELAASPLT